MVRGGSVSHLRLLSNRPWWMRESSQARNLALGNGLEIKPGIRAHFEGHSTVTWSRAANLKKYLVAKLSNQLIQKREMEPIYGLPLGAELRRVGWS